jgi:predicted GH43/DUF377 family glycosyl hydrolase
MLSQYFEVYGQNIPWAKHPDNPVVDVGSPGSWDDMQVGTPSVIFENDTFKMWYGGDDGNNLRIGYATSPDGATWNKDTIHSPVLDVGAPGKWDDEKVYCPSVVFANGIYHMWYSGAPDLAADTILIGHATSPDGLVWTKDPDNPVLEQSPPGNWDYYPWFFSFVIFENDTFHMWYSSYGNNQGQIGYATTTNPNGKNWTKYSGNPVLSPTYGTWDWSQVTEPSIATYNGTLYMFYRGSSEQGEIGFATSTDKVTWYKDPQPCLLRGPAGSWDHYNISFPKAIYDGNEYKMWYHGMPSSAGGVKIGLATVPNLNIVPVELTSFTATSQLGKVILNWATATEINNLGFEIERASFTTTPGQERLWRTIGFVPGKGTTTVPQEYSYIDDISTIQATTLVYRLKQMDFLGTYEYSDEVFVENPAPVDYVLYQNYPNPFNPTTTITFGIPVKTHVVLKVFNAVGEEVAQLCNGEREAGRYIFEFSAEGLPSGIYFYQLRTGEFVQTKKMLLIK